VHQYHIYMFRILLQPVATQGHDASISYKLRLKRHVAGTRQANTPQSMNIKIKLVFHNKCDTSSLVSFWPKHFFALHSYPALGALLSRSKQSFG
jgi:hypothetical protein